MTPLMNRSVCLLLVTLLQLPGHAVAATAAGKLIFVTGTAKATDAEGTERPLKWGSEVFSGERIEVAEKSRAQLRFSDGGMVSLKASTHFAIDDYQYPGTADGSEKSHFSLLKGGFRAMSGAIGKKDESAYRVKTNMANIGIRGTGYTAQLCQGDCFQPNGEPVPDGLYAKTNLGTIFIRNAAGELVLAVGQMGYVNAPGSTPTQTFRMPLSGAGGQGGGKNGNGDKRGAGGGGAARSHSGSTSRPQPPGNGGYASGSQTTSGGITDVFDESGQTLLNFALNTGTCTRCIVNWGDIVYGEAESGTPVFGTNGEIESWDFSASAGSTFTKGGATLAESGADNTTGVRWGRWIGTYSVTPPNPPGGAASSNQTGGFHYMYGELTPAANLGALTGTRTLSAAGGTTPTASSGSPTSFTTGSMTVDFTNTTLSGSFSITHNGDSWAVSYNNFNYGGNAYATAGPLVAGSCTGACPNGGVVNGGFSYGFVGSQANGVITDYVISDSVVGVTGTQLYK